MAYRKGSIYECAECGKELTRQSDHAIINGMIKCRSCAKEFFKEKLEEEKELKEELYLGLKGGSVFSFAESPAILQQSTHCNYILRLTKEDYQGITENFEK